MQPSMDTTLEVLKSLKASGDLEKAYLHLCRRINEYQLSADSDGNVYNDGVQISACELLSILRRDIKNGLPHLSNKAANFLCKATLKALIRNLHLMQAEQGIDSALEIDCASSVSD